VNAKVVKILAGVRSLCLAQIGATERLSHATPCWFIGKSPCFAMFTDNHHGDGRTALWLAAPEGAAAMLIDSEPDHYFYPPYVGPSGWVGVRLDRAVTQGQIAVLIEAAYAAKATSTAGRTRRPSPRAAVKPRAPRSAPPSAPPPGRPSKRRTRAAPR
jgi:hypothetical protein